MRAFALLPLLATLAAAAVTPFKRDTCLTEMPCGNYEEDSIKLSLAVDYERRDLSNAQRLSRGLPPNIPSRRWDAHRRHEPGPSGTPTDPTPAPEPTPDPEEPEEPAFTTYRGKIKISRADGTGELGYLSSHPFSGAQHRYEDEVKAMIVTFKVPEGQTAVSQIELSTENSDIQATFPLLGLVQGRDNTNSDLSKGSFHYLYLAGTDQTPPGSPPVNVRNSYSSATGTSRTAESAVWSFDSITNALSMQWINTDGSAPAMEAFTQGTALYWGGDAGSFHARYPSPVIKVVYTFVPL